MRPSGAFVSFFQPVSKTAGATATGYIDTFVNGVKGHHASIAWVASQADAATNKPTVLKLTQSDTTDSTNFANISGFVGGTDFTVGNQLTGGSCVHQFELDLTGRKRYIALTGSPLTTQICAGVAYISRLNKSPVNATDAGTLNYVAG